MEITAELGALMPGNVRVPEVVLQRVGWYVDVALRLGRRTADLHLALAADTETEAFAPVPLTHADLDRVVSLAGDRAEAVVGMLRGQIDSWSPPVREHAAEVLFRLPDLRAELAGLPSLVPDGLLAIRIHGDYHLGQVLWDEGDFYIIDFEGEPARPLTERRARQSPLKDVAGMVRSFSYAVYARLGVWQERRPEDAARLFEWARFWEASTRAVFLRSYQAAANTAAFVPQEAAGLDPLLRLFLIEKAVYELHYELNNRPAWVHIPLAGLAELLRGDPGTGRA